MEMGKLDRKSYEDTEGLRPLIFGSERKRSIGAVLLAGILFCIVVGLDYAYLVSGMYGTPPAWQRFLYSIFTLQSPLGILLIFGLAVSHAYLNLGYLSTLLLGASVKLGDALVYYAEYPGIDNWNPEPSDFAIAFGLDPYFLTEYASLKILLPVTFGFLLGIWLRGQIERRRVPTPKQMAE